MAQIDVPQGDDLDLGLQALKLHAPELTAAASAYSQVVYQKSKLSLREMEGARYRTAQLNGCVVCQGFRAERDLIPYIKTAGGSVTEGPAARGPAPDEAFYQAVIDWRTSPLFSPRERVAIELAERMGARPLSMHGDDAFWEEVHAVYSDGELADLALSIGSWIALGRVVHTLELDTVCPMPSVAAA